MMKSERYHSLSHCQKSGHSILNGFALYMDNFYADAAK